MREGGMLRAREVGTCFCEGAGLLSVAKLLFLVPDVIGELSKELLRSLSARIGLFVAIFPVEITKKFLVGSITCSIQGFEACKFSCETSRNLRK